MFHFETDLESQHEKMEKIVVEWRRDCHLTNTEKYAVKINEFVFDVIEFCRIMNDHLGVLLEWIIEHCFHVIIVFVVLHKVITGIVHDNYWPVVNMQTFARLLHATTLLLSFYTHVYNSTLISWAYVKSKKPQFCWFGENLLNNVNAGTGLQHHLTLCLQSPCTAAFYKECSSLCGRERWNCVCCNLPVAIHKIIQSID